MKPLYVCEVEYLELTGNVFLKFNGVYIEKTGKEKLRKGRDKLKSLFSPVSSRIIRVLLDEPQKEGKLIELFRESGASIGYVHKVVESFHEQEYLVKEKKIRIRSCFFHNLLCPLWVG